jgi:hypothetical protein
MILNAIKHQLFNKNNLNLKLNSIINRKMRFCANLSTLMEDIPNHIQTYKQIAQRFR